MKLIVNNKLLSIIVNRTENLAHTVSNSIESERGVAHLRPMTLGIFDKRSTRFAETSFEVQKVL
ncbi:uncharacterized protein METZ01_LOCUS48651 [marine metagenome]|uniref:Uncharacterized protein n=1 Tax=marine metagenome TaxID=408172 RepID=A0A381S0P6_9ZZZZ